MEKSRRLDGMRTDLVSGVELVVHEASDDARLADRLVPEEDELELGERGHVRHLLLLLLLTNWIVGLASIPDGASDLNLTSKKVSGSEEAREKGRGEEEEEAVLVRSLFVASL